MPSEEERLAKGAVEGEARKSTSARKYVQRELRRLQWCRADLRLDSVTRQEQSLNLFHALGKVFYNKRERPLAMVRD